MVEPAMILDCDAVALANAAHIPAALAAVGVLAAGASALTSSGSEQPARGSYCSTMPLPATLISLTLPGSFPATERWPPRRNVSIGLSGHPTQRQAPATSGPTSGVGAIGWLRGWGEQCCLKLVSLT